MYYVRIVIGKQSLNNPGDTLTMFVSSPAFADLPQLFKGRKPNMVKLFVLKQTFESVDAVFRPSPAQNPRTEIAYPNVVIGKCLAQLPDDLRIIHIAEGACRSGTVVWYFFF